MYVSAKTDKDNVGVSPISQAGADAQAAAMDANGCRDCRGCENCWGCRDCRDCRDCEYCENCRGCENCENCKYCRNCRGCQNCQSCEVWSGPPATELLSLNGLCWPVATDGVFLQIGHQNRSVIEWDEMTVSDTANLNPLADAFRKTHEGMIRVLINTRKGIA